MHRTSTPSTLATLLLLLLAINSVQTSSIQCLTLKGELRDVIDARQMLNTEENILSCMILSLQKGRIGQTRSIVDLYGQQYQHQLVPILQRQLHRLELIEEEVIQGESNCVPVVKWGQNQTHLFISMKMSHRWDSPPCLNTRQQNASLTTSTFQYINDCVVSHQKITFNLTLNFYDEVNDELVDVKKDGVGTYSIIIEKEESRVWPFLAKDEVCYPIWDEIAQRYNPIHKEYTDLLNSILRERKSKPVQYEEARRRGQKKRSGNGQTLQDILVEAAVEQAIENSNRNNSQQMQPLPQQQTINQPNSTVQLLESSGQNIVAHQQKAQNSNEL